MSSLLFTHNHCGEQHAARLAQGHGGRQAQLLTQPCSLLEKQPALTPTPLKYAPSPAPMRHAPSKRDSLHSETSSAHLGKHKQTEHLCSWKGGYASDTHSLLCYLARHSPSEGVFKSNTSWEIPSGDSSPRVSTHFLI